jgi:hypothetical protein
MEGRERGTMRRRRAVKRTMASCIGLSAAVVLVALGTLACQSGDDAGTRMDSETHMEAGAETEGEHDHSHAGGDEAVTYTCPMHPEVTSEEPGKCPECGMFLVEAGSEEATMDPSEMGMEVWTCPMHPEVQRHEPGECPECGMDLVEAESEGTE